MAKDLVLKTKGKKPVQSARGIALVPAGTYVLAPTRFELKETQKENKPLVNVRFEVTRGDYKGKQIIDTFVFPRAGTKDSDFGLARFLGLVKACGVKDIPAQVKLSKVTKTIKDKECVSEIEQTVMPATEEYPEKPVSRPFSFYPLKSSEAKKLLAGETSSKASDDDENEDEDEDEDESDEDGDEEDESDEDEEEGEGDEEDEDEEGDDEDADEDEEDEDEEEEKPKKSSKSKSKSKPKAKATGGRKSKSKKKSDDDELDDDFFEEDEEDED